MLRITPIKTDSMLIIKLEGRLSGPWVDEMHTYWASHVDAASRVTIQVNLRDVSYLDYRGRDLLLRMKREGASLVGASEFLRHLLSVNNPDSEKPCTPEKENQNGSSIRS